MFFGLGLQGIIGIVLIAAILLLVLPGDAWADFINFFIKVIEEFVNFIASVLEFIVNIPVNMVNWLIDQLSKLIGIDLGDIDQVRFPRLYLGRVYLRYEAPIIVLLKTIVRDPVALSLALIGIILVGIAILDFFNKLPIKIF